MNVKRARFIDPIPDGTHPLKHGTDASSVPSEMTEAPQSSKDPKTSEYAFFKKLKQSVSSTSCRKPLDSESTPSRKLKKGKKFQESGNVKHKEAKSLIYAENPEAIDADSFMFVKDAGQEHAVLTSKSRDDHVMSKSSSLLSVLRTPTMELDAFLASDDGYYSFTKPQSLLREGDIFSSKRLKLRQLVAKTLFPDTGVVPKECDVVSLLLSRLLPKESENIQFGSPNMKLAKTKATSQMHDPHTHVEDDWDTSLDAKNSHFSCSGVSPVWSRESKERHHSSKITEDIDSRGTRMLLGYGKMNRRENCSNDIGSVCWSNRFGDRNLPTWSNEDPLQSIRLPKSLADASILVHSNDDQDSELQMHRWGSYDGVSCHRSLESWDKSCSYRFPTESYSSFPAIDAKRTDLELIDERFDSSLNKRAPSFENYGSFESRFVREELNKLEIRREPSRSLLGWSTDQTYKSELSHTSHMELDADPLPLAVLQSDDDDLYSFDNYRMVKTGSRSYFYWDRYTQNRDIEDEIPVFSRSRCSASTSSSYDVAQSEQMSGLFLPQTHQLSAEKTNALVFCEGAYSDLGLKSQPLTPTAEEKYDQFADDVLQSLRWDDRSFHFLENENDRVMSRPENWSLLSVRNRVGHEDLFRHQIHKVSWIDSEVETFMQKAIPLPYHSRPYSYDQGLNQANSTGSRAIRPPLF